jgi:hypothetical protein
MATTQNTYTGNGSNKLFSITFPYLETTDVDVYLNGTLQTAYSFANATTIEFVTAPANGATVLLKRSTDDTNLQATFFPGSSIKASDLNSDFDQVLFIAQETSNTATTAVSTANTASSNASAAVSTANTASSNASAAVSTANAANSTANTASTNASNAVGVANAATATANTASANASSAVTTANAAQADATNAIAAVSAALLYVIVANVAAIPTTSLTNNQGIQVTNTTGLESFTPLSGIPVGFVGSAALYARIRYSTSTSSWVWVDYAANDPEGRYLAKTGGTMTGALVLSGAPTVGLNPTTKTYVDAADSTLTTAAAAAQTTANAALPKAGGAMTGDITLNAQSDLRFADADSSNWVAFQAPATVATNVTWTLPATDASVSGYALKSDGSGQLSWGLAGGGALGSGANQIFYENDQTVTGNYSITAGKNAMTAGPVTVNSGVTVTVPTGSFWSII